MDKRKAIMLFLFLALIIALSGCIDAFQKKDTKITGDELLKIKQVDVFPSTNIAPGTELTIRMTVENMGKTAAALLIDRSPTKIYTSAQINCKDDNSNYGQYEGFGYHCTAPNIFYDYCDGIYNDLKLESITPSHKAKCKTLEELAEIGLENPLKDACYLIMDSEEQLIFQWSLKAPDKDKIAGMEHECTFKFQAQFEAEAQTDSYIYFAPKAEVEQGIYTSRQLKARGDNIAKEGPIAINLIATPQPIVGESGGTWNLGVNLKNVGDSFGQVYGLDVELADAIYPKENEYSGAVQKTCELSISTAEKSKTNENNIVMTATAENCEGCYFSSFGNTEYLSFVSKEPSDGRITKPSENVEAVYSCISTGSSADFLSLEIQPTKDIACDLDNTKKYPIDNRLNCYPETTCKENEWISGRCGGGTCNSAEMQSVCSKTGATKCLEDNTCKDQTGTKYESCKYFLLNSVGNKLIIDHSGEEAENLLKIYGKKSSQLMCELTSPEANVLTPMKFTTKADYQYTIPKTVRITVNPRKF